MRLTRVPAVMLIGMLILGAVITQASATTAHEASTTRHHPKPTVSVALRGMGATQAQMKVAHGVSYIKGGLCSAAPYCFGPVVRNDEGFGYQFTGDSFSDGLLSQYTQTFASHTTLTEAEAQVQEWLPPDAKMGTVTIDRNGGSCAIYTMTSPTLAKLFSPHADLNDPQGVVGVELGYIDSNFNLVYNPNNIQHADLSLTPNDPTAAC